MLKVMEATTVPTLSSVLPMFGLSVAGLNDSANAVGVIEDEVHVVKVSLMQVITFNAYQLMNVN